jgi:hypothetical protein
MRSNENISKMHPRITNAIEGTIYQGLNLTYLCQPAIKSESPANTENKGHNFDNENGIIFKDDKKRKNPICKKNAAMKK